MFIYLDNVSIRFPIYDVKQRSFKQTLLNTATGGRIIRNQRQVEIEALKNITLNCQQGDRIALIGHNGSGKTTLLRVMAGVYAPSSGTIRVQGKVTSLLDAMLGMDHEASGLENIYLRGLFLGLTPKEIRPLIDEIIAFSELDDFIHMPVRTYSSGMVLRLAFSISTVIEPEILLMDEWMSVGDDVFRQKAEVRLQEFVNRAGILVMATHDFEMAKRVCTRHIYLEHGQIQSVN
ncbi:ABC transporter ATP-binding protein [Dichelobacter nodosus]|uniref:ABC transporter ATP-binding protein n=1 Tax=Dichelobacter nodosus TaxID=870 RepID=UPI000E28D878|nr:ABC transporter ATP-binding protein [Dichelobacter nodosus]AXM45236.1 ABC transporter ATP-binding protein [Dichelobacter nodosus]